MDIIVYVKEVSDVRIPVAWDEATGRLRKDRQVWQMNPPDRSALAAALAMKTKAPEARVTAIHLGPPAGERILRECLALGCDRVFRVWDELWEEIQPHAKAFIFARVAEIFGYDLLFTGSASQDSGNGQVGLLLASYLNIPCIISALKLEIAENHRSLIAVKSLDEGRQARVSAVLPAAITMEALPESGREPALASRLEAWECDIPCLHPSELGIPGHRIQQMNSCLQPGPLQWRHPRLKPIPAPDPQQPAFLRIARLIHGTAKGRTGKMIRGTEVQVVEELFQTLLKEGWLDHLKKKTGQRTL